MKYFSCVIILVFLAGNISLAEQKIPDGWREPSENEITDNEFKARSKASYRYLAAKADFNGDGITDTAKILVNDLKRKMGLFVFVSRKDKFQTILLDQSDDLRWVDEMGLSVVNPGTYKTACGKGYWECEKDTPEVLVLNNPAINYFAFESANSFFVWEERSKSFKRIWMSD